MPRAYIEMIFSSKPGKRRWYLPISAGSNVPVRSRGMDRPIEPPSVGTVLWSSRTAAARQRHIRSFHTDPFLDQPISQGKKARSQEQTDKAEGEQATKQAE